MTKTVRLTKDAGLGIITLDNPGKMNAVTFEMMAQLKSILDRLATDEEVRVVVIRGEGDNFCSGIETSGLTATTDLTGEQRAAGFEASLSGVIGPLIKAFLALPQPVVGSIKGYAIALGISFALASDLIIASHSAKFVLPQVRLGHTLDHGESWLLPRRIGLSRAMQLTLTGETLSGEDAARFNLANWLTADEDLQDRTAAVAENLLRLPPIALRQSKAILNASLHNTLDDQMAAEMQAVMICAASDDFAEAMSAFMERRQGHFRGI